MWGACLTHSMSKRLQVLLDEPEYRILRQTAKRNRMTVSEWVRQAQRGAIRQEPTIAPERKLAAVRASARYDFPSGSIEQMLSEIERGYVDEVLAVEVPDVERAKTIVQGHTDLSARDAIHLAIMERVGAMRIMSFDRGFDAFPGVTRLGA